MTLIPELAKGVGMLLSKAQIEAAKAFVETVNEKDQAFILIKVDHQGAPSFTLCGDVAHIALMRLAVDDVSMKMLAQISQVQLQQQEIPQNKPKLKAVESEENL